MFSKSTFVNCVYQALPACLALCYVLALVLPGSYLQIAGWPWALLPQAGFLLGGLLALRYCTPLGKPFDGLVGFTLAGLVGSAATSADPERSWWYLVMVCGYFACLYGMAGGLASGTRTWVRPWLGSTQMAFSLVSLGLYGQNVWSNLLLSNAGAASPWTVLTNNTYPLGHHNFVAGYLALTLPVSLSLGIERRGWERWVWVLAGGLGLLTLATTQSRGGWLGVLVGCVITGAVSLGGRHRPSTWAGRAALLAGVALAGLLAWLSVGVLNTKTAPMFEGRDVSTAQRLVYWQTGLRMWQEHPWFGVGPGMTGFAYPQYRSEDAPWAGRVAQQLHSTPVHLLAETGTWGFAAYLGWLGTCGWLLWRSLGSARSSVAALAGALVAYSIAGLTDFQLENPAISATLILLVAELVRIRGSCPSRALQLRPLGLGLLLCVVIGWGRIDWAWWESERAFAAAWKRDWVQFTDRLRIAQAIDPTQPYYPLQQALLLAREARQIPEGDLRTQLLTNATLGADRAVQLLERDPLSLTIAGWLHLYRSDLTGAAALFERALQLDTTTTPTLHLGMGMVQLAGGEVDSAILHLSREVVLFPAQWADERWQTAPLAALRPRVANEAIRFYEPLLRQYPTDADLRYQRAMLYVWARQYDLARQDLQAIPAQASPWPGAPFALRLPSAIDASLITGAHVLVSWQQGRRSEAEQILAKLKQQSPTRAACLAEQLASSPRIYLREQLTPGQDYFLLRRLGGEILGYPEPLRFKTWASMQCLHYTLDPSGRNFRLPL